MSEFSDFIRNASHERRAEVYADVMERVAERQAQVIERAAANEDEGKE